MNKPFNQYENEVYQTAISEGASDLFAKIVIAQFKHESSDFTSKVFKANLNPMGMKMPSKRKSPYIAGAGTKPPGNEGATPYARFNSLADATRDLFHWLRYNNIDFTQIASVDQYAELLRQRSYMGNTQTAKQIYIAGLTRWLKTILESIPGSIPILIPLILFSLVFFYLTLK